MLRDSYNKKPIDSNPRDMFEAETIERLIEGLKLAASCSREMNALEPKNGWNKVAEGFSNLFVSCKKLSRQKAITRGQLLQDADRVRKGLNTDTVNL